MSVIVFAMNKENRRPFVTILTSITATKIPIIIVTILGLLCLISDNSIYKLLNPIATFCQVISIVFMFFAIKAVFGEEDNSKFLKTFIIIQVIYYVVYFVISFLEINI